MFNLVFSRRFAMAHRLIAGASEKCAVPHGHNEIVTVTLTARRPEPLDGHANMVLPFERAKATWHRWIDGYVDHALQLSGADPLIEWFAQHEPQRLDRILVTPGDPTTEALACCMMAKLNSFLAADGARLSCAKIQIEETPTNAVVFDGDPVRALPNASDLLPWWLRADMSINDLAEAALGSIPTGRTAAQ
jgi:6-pyruvoyltetrahydropterin/6-carboxytetrahydropterin synthase